MIPLVPRWAHHYDEFWNAIRSRNLWFIKLRYIIAFALLLFLISGEFLLGFKLTFKQIVAFTSISFLILLYNVIIHYSRKKVGSVPGKFNCLHLSLVQMVLDLTTLLFLIYYTGIIESPMYLFAIFQSIIGSLILPGYVVYIVSGLYIIAFSAMILMQYFDVIHSHYIIGIMGVIHHHDLNYIVLFIIIYTAMIVFSIYLTNKIAHQLYKREQQLRESLIKIQEMEQQKQKYIMGIVHEVKTPIAAMQSITDLILNGYVGKISDLLKEKIDRINQRSSEALTLVNDVLFISKLKLMSLTSVEELDIKEIIENILKEFENDIKSKNIEVKNEEISKNNMLIKGDKIFIELAFKNIISNAIKYTPKNGTILIVIRSNPTGLEINISDSGLGIPQNEIDNIFKEFYRATNVKRSKIEGTGLGLALVKQIIERHFGELIIKSPSTIGTDDNPGTTVTVILPLKSPLGKMNS